MKSFHFHRNNVVSSSVGTHWYTYIPRWSLTKSTFRQIVHTHCLRQLFVWRTLITKPLRHYSRPDTDAMFSIDVHKNIIDYKLNLCLCILVMCNFFWETLLINSNNIFLNHHCIRIHILWLVIPFMVVTKMVSIFPLWYTLLVVYPFFLHNEHPNQEPKPKGFNTLCNWLID